MNDITITIFRPTNTGRRRDGVMRFTDKIGGIPPIPFPRDTERVAAVVDYPDDSDEARVSRVAVVGNIGDGLQFIGMPETRTGCTRRVIVFDAETDKCNQTRIQVLTGQGRELNDAKAYWQYTPDRQACMVQFTLGQDRDLLPTITETQAA